MREPAAAFAVVDAVVEVGGVFGLDGEADGVRAGKVGVGEVGGVVEVFGGAGDVVHRGEEEGGAGFGDGDGG